MKNENVFETEELKFLRKLVSSERKTDRYIFNRLAPIIFRDDFSSDLQKIKKDFPVPIEDKDNYYHNPMLSAFHKLVEKYNLKGHKIPSDKYDSVSPFIHWEMILRDYLYHKKVSSVEMRPFDLISGKYLDIRLNPLATQEEIISSIREIWTYIKENQKNRIGLDVKEPRSRPYFERDIEIYRLYKLGEDSRSISRKTPGTLPENHIRQIINEMKAIFEPKES